MNRWIWSRHVGVGVLSVMALFGFSRCVKAAEERHAPAHVQSQSKSPLTEVTELNVACEDLETLTLEVEGKTASGERATVSEELPFEAYQVESEPFDRYDNDDEGDYTTACYRIVYREGSRAYVAGTVDNITDREGDPSGTYVELRNVSWGFDLKTQKFWVRARPDRMSPLPRMFRRRDWAGVRFLVPLPLKRFRPEEIRTLIEGRGGVVAGREGPVDAIVLPDVFTFTGSRPRNADAEKWMRKGASVLLEKNFPNSKEQPAD